jgi:hypothetical protein
MKVDEFFISGDWLTVAFRSPVMIEGGDPLFP